MEMDLPVTKKRNQIMPFLALLRKSMEAAFGAVVSKNIMQVKVANEKVIFSYFNKVSTQIDKLTQAVADMPKIEFKDTPASINIQSMSKDTIKNLTDQITELKNVMKQNKTIFPHTQTITGKVQVMNQQEFPMRELIEKFDRLEKAIGSIQIEIPEQREIQFPEFPKTMELTGVKQIVAEIKSLKKELEALPEKMPKSEEMKFPTSISVDNFPNQRYPIPPNNININPLRGFVKSTAVTVTTALTPLPGEVLSNRRSLVIYNNSANTTIYIGGSTMSTADGIPVPAGTYSPAFDAGSRMIVYAMTITGSADIRVMELSNDAVGSG